MTEDPERLDMMHSKIGVGSHTLLGIIMGYASIMITAMIGNVLTVALGVAIIIAFGYVLEKFIGKKGIKWWFGNGIIVYLLIWLIAWTFFFNVAI